MAQAVPASPRVLYEAQENLFQSASRVSDPSDYEPFDIRLDILDRRNRREPFCTPIPVNVKKLSPVLGDRLNQVSALHANYGEKLIVNYLTHLSNRLSPRRRTSGVRCDRYFEHSLTRLLQPTGNKSHLCSLRSFPRTTWTRLTWKMRRHRPQG